MYCSGKMHQTSVVKQKFDAFVAKLNVVRHVTCSDLINTQSLTKAALHSMPYDAYVTRKIKL